MLRKSRFALTIAGLLIASGTIAAQTYVKLEQRFTAEQLRETGLDTLSPAQLEKLNQLLSVESEKISSVESPRIQDETRQASYIGLDDKPIKSRLKGSISGWDVDTVFELENGQKWKVLKGNMKMRQPMQAPDIVVVPGIAGRWFLQVDEDLPKARVYRID
jgi:acetyl/propionyl-CoA carboxylase alpha subunit